MKTSDIEWNPSPNGAFLRWQNTLIATAKYHRLRNTASLLIYLVIGFISGTLIGHIGFTIALLCSLPIVLLMCIYILLATKAWFYKISIQHINPANIKYVPEGVDDIKEEYNTIEGS